MVSYLTLWIILVGVGAPLTVYFAFVRPDKNIIHVPPILRALPLVILTTVSVILVLSPVRWHQVITQYGFLALQVPTFVWRKYIPLPPRKTSILGLNQKD